MHGDSILVESSALAAPIPDPSPGRQQPGDLNDELLNTPIWTDEMVQRAGIPIVDTQFVSVGGGMGSFCMVDHLRIAGVPTSSIKVLSNLDVPWQTYEYLTRVSQIPRMERLRSDSSGRPDNVWGFPSYALHEAWHEKTLAPLWSVVTEPVFTDYWTPRAGTVFRSLEREAARIRWQEVHVKGQVRLVRRRQNGGYFTINTPQEGTAPTKRVAYRSQYVHLAVGYPGLRFLPDLQEYRQQHNDFTRVVNAYEPHEFVYDTLKANGGTVLVRGSGIVASRVLQRLMEDRWDHGANTRILHLFRTYYSGRHGPTRFGKRRGSDGFAYQGFNWPKSAWGGQYQTEFERLEGDERKALYERIGGTHTPYRRLWQNQKSRARSEGWYDGIVGTVQAMRPADGSGVISTVKGPSGDLVDVRADFIIDATGLEGDLRDHRLPADLLDHSGAGRNVLGRLDVERSFEVRGVRSGEGRMYAVGAMTLGGYYAGVDTFLGLQFSSLRIVDDLAAQGFGHRIGVGRSISQWWKWFRHRSI